MVLLLECFSDYHYYKQGLAKCCCNHSHVELYQLKTVAFPIVEVAHPYCPHCHHLQILH